ncbi:MAG TPA: hypothetical protein VFY19_08640, partial [Geminicoccaceae bacterium]|nr:hypothetical protein [Geminicoccaceae bacterium]
MARRVGLALGVALGLILLALVAGYGLAQTTGGKRFISAQLERALAGPERSVEAAGLEGRVPFDMRLARLTFADDEGVWLEVEGVRLDLAPAALLRGRLVVEEVSAELIRVLRPPPATPDEADDEPFRLPELPDSVPPLVVERLAVERIELAPAVLGEPAAFTLAGRLASGEDGGSAVLALSAERVDRPTARAALDARLDLDPAALELALSVEETGGLLAAASARPEAGALALRLSGAGPLDGWVGNLELQAESLASAEGRLEVELAEQPRVRLDATLRPAPALLPDQLAALVGERLSLALTVTQTAAQRLRIEDLQAEIAAAQLTGRAEVDLEDEQLSAEARLAVPDLAPLGPLADTPISGALSAGLVVKGALLHPDGRIELEVTAPEVAGVAAERIVTALDFAVVGPPAPDQLALQVSGTGRAERLRLPDAVPLPPQDLSWRLDLTAPRDGPVVVRELALSAPDVELQVSGSLDPQTLAGEAEAGLRVSALAPLTAPLGKRVEGEVSLNADLRLAAGAEEIEIDLSGRAEDLAGLPPGAAELLGPAPRLTALATLIPDERVEISSLTLEGAAATLGGELALTLPEEGLAGNVTLALPRLAALAPALGQELAGGLEIEASPAGTLDAPTVTLALRGEDLLLAGRPIDRLTLRTSARDLLTAPAGELEAGLSAAGLEAGLTAEYLLQDRVLRLAGLRVNGPRTTVAGDLSIDLERTLIEGELQGEVADLVAFEPLLPLRLRGAAEFELRLEPAEQGQSVALALDASQLRSDFGRLRQLRLRATVADALGKPAIEADLDLDGYRHGRVALDELSLAARGTLDELALTLAVEGEAVEPFTLDGRARLALGEATELRLEQLDGTLAERPLRIVQPAVLTLAEAGTRLSGLDLRWGDARLRASADLGRATVAAEASLDALPLALLGRFGAPPLAGQADATLRLSGAADDPRGRLDLTLTGVRAQELAFAELPAAEFTLRADLAERRLSIDLEGQGVTEQPMTLTAELPLVARFDQLEFDLPKDGRLSARL